MTLASFPELEIEVLWSAHHRWHAGQSRRFAALNNTIFWIAESGEAILEAGGKPYQVRGGDAVLQPAGLERCISACPDFSWFSVGFRARWFRGQDAFQSLDIPYIWNEEANSANFLMACLSEISRSLKVYNLASQLRVEGAMRSMLGCCFENCPLPQNTREFPIWLENALRALREEPEVELNELAARIGYSPSQFRAQFKRWIGASPSDYARAAKLQRARQLLRETDWMISQIAEELGFAAPTHFVRAFKAETGITPAKFRQNSGF